MRKEADEWRLEQGWIDPDATLLEKEQGAFLGVGRTGKGWRGHRFIIFAPDNRSKHSAQLEARLYSALKAHHHAVQEDTDTSQDTPAMEHRFDVMVRRAASWYSSDYIFTCRTL